MCVCVCATLIGKVMAAAALPMEEEGKDWVCVCVWVRYRDTNRKYMERGGSRHVCMIDRHTLCGAKVFMYKRVCGQIRKRFTPQARILGGQGWKGGERGMERRRRYLYEWECIFYVKDIVQKKHVYLYVFGMPIYMYLMEPQRNEWGGNWRRRKERRNPKKAAQKHNVYYYRCLLRESVTGMQGRTSASRNRDLQKHQCVCYACKGEGGRPK